MIYNTVCTRCTYRELIYLIEISINAKLFLIVTVSRPRKPDQIGRDLLTGLSNKHTGVEEPLVRGYGREITALAKSYKKLGHKEVYNIEKSV